LRIKSVKGFYKTNVTVIRSLFLLSLSFTLLNTVRRYNEGKGKKKTNLVILYGKRILKRGNCITTLQAVT